MTHPLVSIAMCTYNGERFLNEQLESIANQTYKNIELIIVDDCSFDKTVEIIKDYQSRFSFIKVFQNDINLGFNKNFEKALSLATGEYIAISDQDDIWHTTKIEKLVNGIGDKLLIFSNSSLIDEKGVNIPGELLSNFSLDNINYKSVLLTNFITGHTSLIKGELLQFCNNIPEKGFYDWFIGFVALYFNSAVYLNEQLTQYRIHSNSVIQKNKLSSQSKSAADQLNYKIICAQLQVFKNYFRLNQEDKSYISELLNAYVKRKNRFSFQLFKFIYKNYDELFSMHKHRSKLSRLNFAYKFARRLN